MWEIEQIGRSLESAVYITPHTSPCMPSFKPIHKVQGSKITFCAKIKGIESFPKMSAPRSTVALKVKLKKFGTFPRAASKRECEQQPTLTELQRFSTEMEEPDRELTNFRVCQTAFKVL